MLQHFCNYASSGRRLTRVILYKVCLVIVCGFLHFSSAMQSLVTTFTILPNHPHSLAYQMGMKNNKPTVAVLEIYCSVCHKFTKHQYCVIC